MTLVKKGAIVLATLVAFQIAIFAVIFSVHLELRRGAEHAEHAVALSRAAARAIVDILMLTRKSTTVRKKAGAEIDQMIVQQRRDLNELKALVRSEPDRLTRARLSLETASQCLDILERGRRLEQINPANLDRLVWDNLRKRANGALDDANSVVKFLEEEQFKINKILENQGWWQRFNQQLLIAAIVLEVALAGLFAFLFRHDISGRMGVLIDNSERLAKRRPLPEALPGGDEIATLDAAFHEVASALATAEENEKAIIENALDMICQLDREGAVVQVNEAAGELLGYAEGELVGRQIFALCLAGERASIEEQLDQSRAGAHKPFETKLVRKDGRVIDVRFSIAWAEPDRSYFCVIHDISAIKHAERLRQEVVQMVSHDLKSPLFTVSSFLEMLSGELFGELTEKGRSTVDLAFAGCSQMLALIKDLLDMEKLGAGMLELSKETLDLADVVERSLELVRPLCDKKEVVVERQAASGKYVVSADRERLTQIVVNLLENAIKFSPSRSRVSVVAEAGRLRGEEAVCLKVSDCGRGIPCEQQPFIFDRFHQVRRSDRKDEGTTGLGLAIVKALVELHGGVVEVESATGEGATFKVTLPARLAIKESDDELRPFA